MSQLHKIAEQIGQQKKPPVHLWQPTNRGVIDIVIDAQGRWFHEGGEIRRAELVRLFASILWLEDGKYYLVTPVEKLLIRVVDVPFIVQRLVLVEGVWVASINTGETVMIGHKYPLELREFQGQPIPYVRVRYDLWARLNRNTYYQLVSAALDSDQSKSLGLKSGDYQISLSDD